MKKFRFLIAAFLLLAAGSLSASAAESSVSVYQERPSDKEAVFFDASEYGLKADGKSDVTEALQEAIFKVKKTQNFGILFLPEGTYRISGTIQVPSSVRVIGYGKTRPVLYLAPGTEGFSEPSKYMMWFTGGMAEEGRTPSDANAGTFYSAVSNVDFRIGKNNPGAVAIRSHFAQHCFINHCDIYAGDAYACIEEIGNELEDVRFFGGQYGIVSGRTSPGWPMMMVDTYFEGQKKAAILSREAGFAIVAMHVKNVPVAFDMADGTHDRLHLENSLLENVKDAGIKVSTEDNTFSQLNLVNVSFRNVPSAIFYKQSGRTVKAPSAQYVISSYVYGNTYGDMASEPVIGEICNIRPVKEVSAPEKDLPVLPQMSSWVNVREYGAVGDGKTDDTEAFEKAIAAHDAIYVPTGWYRLTRTLKLGKNTKLIGLHPFATQFVLAESEPAFSGFGSPVPAVETPCGGHNIINGIGIFTGAYNYRAVGCKWQSDENSFLNDVKFIGGHGTLRKPVPGSAGRGWYPGEKKISSPDSPVYGRGQDQAWDNQYWSLWVTGNGGGTIKDIWTADTYAAAGVYFSNTSTQGRVYAMSLEHHVRTEMRLDDVSNWKMYAVQFEEEGSEGPYCHNVEMSRCHDVEMNNVWMYRVIRAFMPKEIGFRVWSCSNVTIRNMHNYTQILPVIEFPLFQMNKNIPVYAWDFASLTITGDEKSARNGAAGLWQPEKVVSGFELASGAVSDSKGNVYFCEHRMKKIYRLDAQTGEVALYADFPWKPLALGVDTEDRLLVVARYDPQPGFIVDGKPEQAVVLPDDNPMYSGWGNGGWEVKMYAIEPGNQDSMTVLPLVRTSEVSGIKKVWHPASRWRGDFTRCATAMTEYAFLAPDNVTMIPQTFDLFRCSAMISVIPGQKEKAYVADEMTKETIAFDVNADGRLVSPEKFAPYSQYSTATDSRGNVYVADGEIFVYDAAGKLQRTVRLEERPISIAVGGQSDDTLYITTEKSVYSVKISG